MSIIVFDCIPISKIGLFDNGIVVIMETDNRDECLITLDDGTPQASEFAVELIVESIPGLNLSPSIMLSTRIVVDRICDYDRPAFENFIKSHVYNDRDALVKLSYSREKPTELAS